jgi:hypothetical protein
MMTTGYFAVVLLVWAATEFGATLYVWRVPPASDGQIHSAVGLECADRDARRRRNLELLLVALVLCLQGSPWFHPGATAKLVRPSLVHAAAFVGLTVVNVTRGPAFTRWTAAYGRARDLIDQAIAAKASRVRDDTGETP